MNTELQIFTDFVVYLMLKNNIDYFELDNDFIFSDNNVSFAILNSVCFLNEKGNISQEEFSNRISIANRFLVLNEDLSEDEKSIFETFIIDKAIVKLIGDKKINISKLDYDNSHKFELLVSPKDRYVSISLSQII